MASTATRGARGASISIGNIGFDTIVPTISAFTIPATGTSYTITISTLTVADTKSGIHSYMIKTTNTAPKAGDSGWLTTKPTTYAVPVAAQTGTGTYNLYVWVKDKAGNISASSTDSIALTIT